MIARLWDAAGAVVRFCWGLYLCGLGIWAVICGAGWLVGSLLAHHALSADEWQAFMERLPLIGGR